MTHPDRSMDSVTSPTHTSNLANISPPMIHDWRQCAPKLTNERHAGCWLTSRGRTAISHGIRLFKVSDILLDVIIKAFINNLLYLFAFFDHQLGDAFAFLLISHYKAELKIYEGVSNL